MKKSKSKSSPTLETLEDRRLMTAVPYSSELAALAQYFPKHDGVTNIYLNFDGGNINDPQSGGAKGIAPYTAPAGEDRGTAIQNILYHTAEYFSPFNVHVGIMNGAGNFSKTNGDTTLFIGENSGNYDSAGHKIAVSSTPPPSRDYPGDFKGYEHAPNSDPYDLAFVDPISLNLQTQTRVTDSDVLISQHVAQEAGHTFGLGNSEEQDLMSNLSGNSNAFADDLMTISDYGGPKQYHDQSLVPRLLFKKVDSDETFIASVKYENSYQYLRNFLGLRTLDPIYDPAMIVDPTTVAPSANFAGPPPLITPGSSRSGAVGTTTSYNAFTLVTIADPNVKTPPQVQTTTPPLTQISLQFDDAQHLDPEIMLFNADGTQLLAAVHATSLTYATAPNTVYQFVIGGYQGGSRGAFTVSIKSVPFALNATAPTTTSVNPTLFSKTTITSSIFKTQTALLA